MRAKIVRDFAPHNVGMRKKYYFRYLRAAWRILKQSVNGQISNGQKLQWPKIWRALCYYSIYKPHLSSLHYSFIYSCGFFFLYYCHSPFLHYCHSPFITVSYFIFFKVRMNNSTREVMDNNTNVTVVTVIVK